MARLRLLELGVAVSDQAIAEKWLVSLRDCPRAEEWLQWAEESLRSDFEQLVYHEIGLDEAYRKTLSKFGRARADEIHEIASRKILAQAGKFRISPEALRAHFEDRLHGSQPLSYLRGIPQQPWPAWSEAIRRLEVAGFRSMSRLPAKWNGVKMEAFLGSQAVWAARNFIEVQSPEAGVLGPDVVAPPLPIEIGVDARDPIRLRSYRMGVRDYYRTIDGLERGSRVGRPVGDKSFLAAGARIMTGVSQLNSVCSAGASGAPTHNIAIWLWDDCWIVVPLQKILEEFRESNSEITALELLHDYVDGWVDRLCNLASMFSVRKRD